MDNFLDYLVRRSDIENNEFFNYRQPKTRPVEKTEPFCIQFIDEPVAKSYVVLDFETTGMSCDVNRIIEIGAVKVIDNEIVGGVNTLVNPQQYIPAFISQKVHITNTMVMDKPDISVIMPKLVEFIGDLPVVAHNARFDMGFLLANCKRLGIRFNNPVIDTLKLSRRYNKECAKHNLGYLTDFFNIKLENAHRAYFDAYATYELYRIIQDKYVSQYK